MAVVGGDPPVRVPGSSARSLRLRLRVWSRRPSLIRELAAGGDPDASDELTVVARELIGARSRRRLAGALEAIVRAASQRPNPLRTAVPLNRRAILSAREELARLAERLRDATPVPVHGVALAAVLVQDAGSPLYDGRADDSVARLARLARLGLDDPISR